MIIRNQFNINDLCEYAVDSPSYGPVLFDPGAIDRYTYGTLDALLAQRAKSTPPAGDERGG